MDLKEALFIENQLSPEPTREQLVEALGVLAGHVRNAMWKPADTAPMHERVLVASRCGRTIIAARTETGWIGVGMVPADTSGLFKIAYWMPIPAPPEDPVPMEEIEVSK